jgi:transposase
VPLQLQADAYAEFNELHRSSGMACWAHARTTSALTEEALKRIGQLYVIEAELRELSAEHRLAQHQLRAKPLLSELEGWLRKKRRHCRVTRSWQRRSHMP